MIIIRLQLSMIYTSMAQMYNLVLFFKDLNILSLQIYHKIIIIC